MHYCIWPCNYFILILVFGAALSRRDANAARSRRSLGSRRERMIVLARIRTIAMALCMWPSPTAYIVPRPTVRLRDRSIRSPVNLLAARLVCPMNTTSRPSPKEHQHPTLASASLPSRSSTNPAGRARQGIPELRQLGSGALHDPSRWCSRTPYPGHRSNLHPASSSCEHSPFQRRTDPGPTGCEY